MLLRNTLVTNIEPGVAAAVVVIIVTVGAATVEAAVTPAAVSRGNGTDMVSLQAQQLQLTSIRK